jgi:putative endonuclease
MPKRRPKKPACFVYVLGSQGKGGFKTYVGWTNDLDRRLAAHNAGKGARSTRGRIWALLYAESCKTRAAAMSREWHLKRDRAFRRIIAAPARGIHSATTAVPETLRSSASSAPPIALASASSRRRGASPIP